MAKSRRKSKVLTIAQARKLVKRKNLGLAMSIKVAKKLARADQINLKNKLSRFAKKHKGGGKEKTLHSKNKGNNKLKIMRELAKANKVAREAALGKPGFLRDAQDLVSIAARRNPMSLKKAKALLTRKRKPGRPSFEMSCKLAVAKRVVKKHGKR